MNEGRLRIVDRLALPAGFALLVCAFFHRTLLGERFFQSDFYQTFVPLRTILADAWTRGLPTWTGRLGNGAPILANPAYGAFYPLNLLYLGTDPSLTLTALTVGHIIVGGLGAGYLARRWGFTRAAAWTAAAGFALSGPVVAATAYLNVSWPLAWLPWLLVAYDEATRGRAWRGIVGLAIALVSLVSLGETVMLAAAIAGCSLVALGDVVGGTTDRSWWARTRRAILPSGAAALLALMLASPYLVAVARYFPVSVRASGFTADAIVIWSLHPLMLAGVILPNPFGDANLCGPDGFWAAALVADRGRPLFAGLYAGGLLVALAVVGAIRRWPQRVPMLCWLGALVALALGKYGPVYPLARDANGFDALRFPTKWIAPAMLPLALLAGAGLDVLRPDAAPDTSKRKWAVAVLVVVLALLAAASMGAMLGLERSLASLATSLVSRPGEPPIELTARSAWLGAATRSAIPIALALLALRLLPRAKKPSMVLPIVAALATLDVALANRGIAPTTTSDFYEAPPAAMAIRRDPAGHGRVFIDDENIDKHPLQCTPSPRAAQELGLLERSTLSSYVGAGSGLDLVFNSDTEAFSPHVYASAGVLMVGAPLREKLMLVGAAGATHVVTFREPGGPLVDPMASIANPRGIPLYVYRNPFAVPRARVVPRLTSYDTSTGFIQAVRSAPDDLFLHTALVERQALIASGIASEGAAAEGGRATIVTDDGGSIAIATEGPGGFLVLSDTLVPGWTATLDGKPAPIVTVDLAFRAVPIPEGSHRVEMRYDPW